MITTIGGQLWGMTLALPNISSQYIHKVKNYDGYVFVDKISWANINKNLVNNNSLTSTSSRMFIRFGVSNEDETINDYTLTEEVNSVNINDSLSVTLQSGSQSVSNGVAIYTFTVNNTGSNDVEIGEIGLLACLGSPITIDSVSRKKNFLLARFALKNKVTIAGGTSKTFQMNFGFN